LPLFGGDNVILAPLDLQTKAAVEVVRVITTAAVEIRSSLVLERTA
jgi:hypothetical protein